MEHQVNSTSQEMAGGTGGHNHAGHEGMDHDDHSNHNSHHKNMTMTFHFSVTEPTVLFAGWEIKEISTLLLFCVGIFLMAFIYEGIKYYRENLLWKTFNTLHSAENRKTPKKFSQKHIVQTCLHIVQLTVSYLLMLIFMTYNVWLCLAVLVGSATGYFVFGWKRTAVANMAQTCH